MGDKIKKKTIKIPIYLGDLIIVQTDNNKLIEDKYLKNEFDLSSYGACVIRWPDAHGYTRYVIWFRNKTEYRHIAHESAHLVNMIFKDRSIDLDHENDEPYCYMIGWVVNEIIKTISLDA